MEIDADNMCDDAANKVTAMNQAVDSNSGTASKFFKAMGQTPDKRQWLDEVERRGNGSAAHPWGSDLQPWEIGMAAQEYLHQRVDVAQLVLYVRDLLREYGQLMRFGPVAYDDSVCYSGEVLIDQFAHPYPEDAEAFAEENPWLKTYDPCPTYSDPKRVPVTDEHS